MAIKVAAEKHDTLCHLPSRTTHAPRIRAKARAVMRPRLRGELQATFSECLKKTETRFSLLTIIIAMNLTYRVGRSDRND